MGEYGEGKRRKDYYTYIVDDAYHIRYYNSVVERDFPNVKDAQHCYEVFMGEKKPCENCPMFKDIDRDAIYYQAISTWMDLNCTKVDITKGCSGHLFMTIKSHNLQLGMNKEETTIYETAREGVRSILEINELTGLPIGSTYGRQVEKFMREKDVDYCVIAIDVAHFRLFNQMHGRMAGDRLLIAIADFLKNLDRVYGTFSAYGGGDDYCTVFPYDEKLIQYVRDGITNIVMSFEGIEGFYPLLGGYIIHDKSRMFRDVYDLAVTAMVREMNTEGEIQWYTDEVQKEIEDELLLIPKLQEAMKNGDIVAYLQPKCSISRDRIMGAEALVRWRNGDKMVPPGSFIPQIEQNGFITELDRYIWEKVCQILVEWSKRGVPLVPVSVNVSRKDFYAMNVPQYFEELVKKYGIDKNYLEIEITESAFVEDSEAIHEACMEFRKKGFKVLIDDFGSGYSSLNMLKDIQADVLKLDMKFMDLGDRNEEKGETIIRSMVSMSKGLNISVIAEGVETKEQINLLKKIDCDMVQGYYYYKPMEYRQLEELLNQRGTEEEAEEQEKEDISRQSSELNADIDEYLDCMRKQNGLEEENITLLLRALRKKTGADVAYIMAQALNQNVGRFIYESAAGKKYSVVGEDFPISVEQYEELIEAGNREDGLYRVHYHINNRFEQPNLLQYVCLRDGEFDGTIGIGTYYPRNWTKEEGEMVAQVGRVLRTAVERYRLNRMQNELRRQNTVDLLTNLHNRNAFENLIGTQLEPGDGVGVVYLDLNGLKYTNDKFGHEAGDKLICRAATDLMQCFPYENIYRMGGDEFLVLELNVKEESFREEVGHLQQLMNQDEQARMSYGVVWNEGKQRIKELIREADNRMYADKERYYAALFDK